MVVRQTDRGRIAKNVAKLPAEQVPFPQVIERSGEAWLTTTVLHGRRALRVNINSFLTERRHIDDLLELLERSAKKLVDEYS